MVITNISRHGRKLHFRTDGKVIDENIYCDLGDGFKEKGCFKPELPVRIKLSTAVLTQNARSVILINDKKNNSLHIPTIEWDGQEFDWVYVAVEQFAKKVIILNSEGKVAMWLHRKFLLAVDSVDDFIGHHSCERIHLRLSLKSISSKCPSTFIIYLDGVYQGIGVVSHETNEDEIGLEVIFLFYIEDNNIKTEINFVDGEKIFDKYRNFEVGMVTFDHLVVHQSKISPKIKLIHKVMEEID